MQPASHYIHVDTSEIHVTTWGSPSNFPLVLWHGLARTGRDFDPIAQQLSSNYHVICPDTLGRGLSSWASDPERQYSFSYYEKITQCLFDHFDIEKCAYIGTSMGGTLGMRLCSSSLKARIKALIVNDIAPEVAKTAVDRILEYVSSPPTFKNMTELENYLKTIYVPYGHMTEDQWRLMANTSMRRLKDGQVTLHYDPKITQHFISHPEDFNIWDRYQKIDIPMLILRGENSDLFLPEWAVKMEKTNKNAKVIEIEGCGHAPALNIPEHFEIVETFLSTHI